MAGTESQLKNSPSEAMKALHPGDPLACALPADLGCESPIGLLGTKIRRE